MESVHATARSSTLCSTAEIDDAFRWSEEIAICSKRRDRAAVLPRRRAACCGLHPKLRASCSTLPYSADVLVESGQLTTADMIRLIIRDEAKNGYIGYKFQRGLALLTTSRAEPRTTPTSYCSSSTTTRWNTPRTSTTRSAT